MTPLSDLIARLEAAKEGSRELDALIFIEVFDAELRPRSPTRRTRKLWWFKRNSEQVLHYGENNHPHYTTSLVAALTLVPGALWIIGHQEDCFARILPPVGDGYIGSKEISVTAHTPPLALCIAALKAREAGR